MRQSEGGPDGPARGIAFARPLGLGNRLGRRTGQRRRGGADTRPGRAAWAPDSIARRKCVSASAPPLEHPHWRPRTAWWSRPAPGRDRGRASRTDGRAGKTSEGRAPEAGANPADAAALDRWLRVRPRTVNHRDRLFEARPAPATSPRPPSSPVTGSEDLPDTGRVRPDSRSFAPPVRLSHPATAGHFQRGERRPGTISSSIAKMSPWIRAIRIGSTRATAVGRVHQLHGHPHAAGRPLDPAFEHGTHVQLAADLGDVQPHDS